MKWLFFKAVQFSSAILILMEGIKQLDTGFSFPWFNLIAGITALSLVPAIPSLNSSFLFAGIAVYLSEAVILVIISMKQFDALKKYAGLLYIFIAAMLVVGAYKNFRKVRK
jgi:hypothetical protein